MSVVSNNILAGASGQGGAGGYEIERSLRFNSGDSSFLSRTPSSAGNRRTFTFSGWVKRGAINGNYQTILGSGGGSTRDRIQIFADEKLVVNFNDGNNANLKTTQVLRDSAAWQHIVVSVDTTQATASDRIKIYINGVQVTAFDTASYPSQNYETKINNNIAQYIGNSSSNDLYFDGYLADVHLIDGQALAPTNFGEFDDNGVWQPKKYDPLALPATSVSWSTLPSNAAFQDSSSQVNSGTFNNILTDDSNYVRIANNYLDIDMGETIPAGVKITFKFTSSSDDQYSADYALALSTASNYSPYTEFSETKESETTSDYKTITLITRKAFRYCRLFYAGGHRVARVYYLNISGATASERQTINYGTNGFHLDFKDNSTSAALGTDTSGNSNTWTVNNLSVAAGAGNDSLRDSPSQIADQTVVGNYATFNPLQKYSAITLSNGNLDFTDSNSTNAGDQGVHATIAPVSGKFYWEMTLSALANQNYIGLSKSNKLTQTLWTGGGVDGYYYYNNGNKIGGGNGNGGTSYGASFGVGDVIGVAVDWDNGKVTFYKNGASQGDAFTGVNLAGYIPAFYFNTNQSASGTINFGQRAFAHAAPSGYKALNTASLPTPTIADGSLYFDTKLWSGSSSSQTITYPFTPDVAWVKSRNQGYHHILLDIVRGDNKVLTVDYISGEHNNPSFAGGEFSGNDLVLPSKQNVNSNGNTFVGFAWDAGESTTTIAAGGLNSSAYNQSQTWSSSTGITDNSGTRSSAYIFDGVITGSHSNGFNTYNSTITLANSVTATSSIRFYGAFENATGVRYTVNGTTTDAQPPEFSGNTAFGWASVTNVSFPVTINNVGLTDSSTTNGGRFVGIEIDGKLLVDSGVTPPTNVPSIASTVRANPSAGFSIVSYNTSDNYPTIGHGLNAAPEFIIAKSKTDGNAPWVVYTKTGGLDNYLMLNATAQNSGLSGAWGTSAFTSSTFSAGWNDYYSNRDNMIAYCFAPVEGYSAMGSYIGNGSADGVFIYTGFTPSWLLFKRYDASSDWTIYDTARDPNNVSGIRLRPNLANGDHDETPVLDILSNGFKFRRTSYENGGNDQYIYLAFASHPFKTSRAR